MCVCTYICVHAYAYGQCLLLFQAKTCGMKWKRNHQAEDISPRRITLTRGRLQLAVSFPANTTIRLEDGQLDRLLQKEYCGCKALSASREAIKLQQFHDVVKPLFSLFYKEFDISTIKLNHKGSIHMATIVQVIKLITNQVVT